jgi:hypothetical protein
MLNVFADVIRTHPFAPLAGYVKATSGSVYRGRCQSLVRQDDISSVFSYEKSVGHSPGGIDNVFFWINPVEKCTRSFPRELRQQRKSDIMTSFGLSARSAVSCGGDRHHLLQVRFYVLIFGRNTSLYFSFCLHPCNISQ